MNYLKLVAIILLALAILNLVLFALGIISTLFFWVIIIGLALVAFYIIPNIKEKLMLKEK